MRNRQSLLTWFIIFAILIVSGILTIFLPALLGDGGSATAIPREGEIVVIPLPIPVAGRSEIVVPGWQLMLGMAILVPGLVIGAGLTLGIIYIILSRLVRGTQESKNFQESSSTLQKRQSERIAKLRETRPTRAASESSNRRWNVLTTAITILMFIAFMALLFAYTLIPSGQIVRNETIVNIASALVFILMIVALAGMGLWLRSDRILAVDRSDTLSIPWDFIAVLLTGLLVVGLGIGVIVILNAPA